MIRLKEVIDTTPPEMIGNVQSFEAGWMAACRFMEMTMGRTTRSMGHPKLGRPKAVVAFKKQSKP